MHSGILPLQAPGQEWATQAEVFEQIFLVFLVLGTLVGIVVITYTLYNAYKYRSGQGTEPEDFDPPTVGELPSGQTGGKGKKLFLSFGISAVIVISLVVYAYGLLLYVEEGPSGDDVEAEMQVEVEAYQFGWDFIYPNGVEASNTLRVPEDTVVRLSVTSLDVWHNFGIPELRVKADAIPGEYSDTWFIANETGTYTAECYELCGAAHSQMTAEIVVMEQSEFQEWYEEQAQESQDEQEQSEQEGSQQEQSEGDHGQGAEDQHDRTAAPGVTQEVNA